ncbi:MAG TPA: TlpA disulfide reductase family protein [Polyangiaceae bacterium]|nr:TlpA disulfide reductase family protein [Polyangiaceae bacterium]
MATPRQGAWIIGGVLVLAALLGYSVLPAFRPHSSKLVGQLAPVFTLPVMTGGDPGSRVRSADLRGKVVVIDFWASWCAPCRAEAPIIDRVAKNHPADAVVLGIATSGDDWQRAVEFVRSQNLGYTTLFDEGDHVGQGFHIQMLPTLVVLDRNGVVSSFRARMVHEDEIESLIAEAKEKPISG